MLLCLKCCSAKLLLRAGIIRIAKMHEYLISLHSAYEPCLTEVLHYSALNTIEIRNDIMFNFYLGLPVRRNSFAIVYPTLLPLYLDTCT